MISLAFLLLQLPAFAQTIDLAGENERFAFKVTLRDETGRGEFIARTTVLENFEFKFKPRAIARSPRDYYFAEIFGPKGLTLGREDVLERLTTANGSSTEKDTGYYVAIHLSERGLKRVNGYERIGLRIGSFGKPEAPHIVKLLHADEEMVIAAEKFSFRHRAVAGTSLFREPIVECQRVLDPSAPDREEGATFD